MDGKYFYILCFAIGSVTARYEWSSWTLCTFGCGGGERTRICEESGTALVSTCAPPKMSEIEPCKKDLCKSTDSFPSLPATKQPFVTETLATTTDRWETVQNCECGCKLTGERGTVQTTFKKDILCTWEIEAKDDHFIQLTFNEVANFDWKNGGLYIAGPDMFQTFKNRDGEAFSSNLPFSYKSKKSVNFTLQNTRLKDSFGEVVFEFKYMTYPDYSVGLPSQNGDDNEQKIKESSAKGGTNVILIASIAILVGVILIAVAIILYRKTRNRGTSKMEHPEEGIEDCSSVAGSNRSARQNKLTSPRKDRNSGGSKIVIPKSGLHMMNQCENDRLISSPQHGYPSDGQDVFIQGQEPTVIPTLIHNGQPYINWPMHLPLMNQTHFNYPKHMSFEQITQPGNNMQVYYPNSGAEG